MNANAKKKYEKSESLFQHITTHYRIVFFDSG